MVEGMGTSFTTTDYSYVHTNAVKGGNYYRLLQVDFDGTKSYSDVAYVELEGGKAFSLRPTLATDELMLTTEANDEVVARVVDHMGRELKTFVTGAGQQTLNISDIPSGSYYLQVQQGNAVEMLGFVKL